MSKVVVGMTISVDGFVNDRNGRTGQLYPDFIEWHDTTELQESIRNTGAVVMGRRTFEMAQDPDWYAGNYEYQVPIFVVTHQPPTRLPKEGHGLTFTFVTGGIKSAIEQARAAAGARDVTVIGGASTLQECLKYGLADELHLDVMPVLLGEGLRLFDHLENLPVTTLERLSVSTSGPRTHLKFRVNKI